VLGIWSFAFNIPPYSAISSSSANRVLKVILQGVLPEAARGNPANQDNMRKKKSRRWPQNILNRVTC
jgi:hypothetical protein